jgi:prefoldin subunit 5
MDFMEELEEQIEELKSMLVDLDTKLEAISEQIKNLGKK